VFGTVVNRFCVQAVTGMPLTVYGKGGQQRGYLNITDTLQCVDITLNNPPPAGEFRVFNQFTETFSINDLAGIVQAAGKHHGLDVKISHLANPRVEKEEHYNNPANSALVSLGLKPRKLSDVVIEQMFTDIKKEEARVDRTVFNPSVKWKSR